MTINKEATIFSLVLRFFWSSTREISLAAYLKTATTQASGHMLVIQRGSEKLQGVFAVGPASGPLHFT